LSGGEKVKALAYTVIIDISIAAQIIRLSFFIWHIPFGLNSLYIIADFLPYEKGGYY
jgi:hypothetical protein